MNRRIDAFLFQSKSILCIAMLLGVHVIAGCGSGAGLLSGIQRIDLTSNSQMAGILGGTNLQGATAIEINQATGQFRLVYPEAGREISGTFVKVGGQARVTQFTFAVGDKAATVSFNAADQITQITNEGGQAWVRPNVTTAAPQAPQAPRAPGARTLSTVDSYVAANADLMQLAEELDAQGVTSPDQVDAKVGQASFWPAFFLASFVFIGLVIPATLLFIFEVVVFVTTIL